MTLTSPAPSRSERLVLLVLVPVRADHLATMTSEFDVLYAPSNDERRQRVATDGSRVQAVLTIGTVGLTADEIAVMPALELVCTLGVGYELVDTAALKARGIPLANGAGTNDASVADHAMTLLLAAVRDIVPLDRRVREGLWRDNLPVEPAGVTGARLGVLGLGMIGRKVAHRAEAFGMTIGYASRSAKADVPYTRFDDALALAQWCDFLVVCTPGGPQTRHMVNAAVIAALGAGGVLVNISRGSVVDTAALAQALRTGALRAAGLDVYESEPKPPQELIDLPNVVLTPHVAGRSPQSVAAMAENFLANIRAHVAGRPLVTPVALS